MKQYLFFLRIPSPPVSDSDDSDIDSGLNMEDRLLLVEQRAQEMTSALSARPLNDIEKDLSKQLERMELEREENERLETERQYELNIVKERKNNENFREFGSISPRRLVKDNEIVGANSKTNSSSIEPGRSWNPDHVSEIQGTSMDDTYTTGARPKEIMGTNTSQSESLDKNEPVVVSQGELLYSFVCLFYTIFTLNILT